jgi:hypothetical protein
MHTKRDTIIFWVATGLIFIMEGVMSAIYGFSEMSRVGMETLGFPVFFGYGVATAKILGSIALIVPQAPHWSKEWAYAGFSYVAIFAALTHIVVTGSVGLIVMSGVVLAVVLISRHYYYKLKQQ